MDNNFLSQPVADNTARLLWNECDTTPFTSSLSEKCLLVADASKLAMISKSEDIDGYTSILLLKLVGRELSESELEDINWLTNKKGISVNIKDFEVVSILSDTELLKLCNIRLNGKILFGVASRGVTKVVIDNCNKLSNGVFVFTAKAH